MTSNNSDAKKYHDYLETEYDAVSLNKYVYIE